MAGIFLHICLRGPGHDAPYSGGEFRRSFRTGPGGEIAYGEIIRVFEHARVFAAIFKSELAPRAVHGDYLSRAGQDGDVRVQCVDRALREPLGLPHRLLRALAVGYVEHDADDASRGAVFAGIHRRTQYNVAIRAVGEMHLHFTGLRAPGRKKLAVHPVVRPGKVRRPNVIHGFPHDLAHRQVNELFERGVAAAVMPAVILEKYGRVDGIDDDIEEPELVAGLLFRKREIPALFHERSIDAPPLRNIAGYAEKPLDAPVGIADCGDDRLQPDRAAVMPVEFRFERDRAGPVGGPLFLERHFIP